MAALGRIQKGRNRAENDHDARAQKRHDRNHEDGDDGQDKGVLDQGLPMLAGVARTNQRQDRFDGGFDFHLRKWSGITSKKLHQRDNFDNERDRE